MYMSPYVNGPVECAVWCCSGPGTNGSCFRRLNAEDVVEHGGGGLSWGRVQDQERVRSLAGNRARRTGCLAGTIGCLRYLEEQVAHAI